MTHENPFPFSCRADVGRNKKGIENAWVSSTIKICFQNDEDYKTWRQSCNKYLRTHFPRKQDATGDEDGGGRAAAAAPTVGGDEDDGDDGEDGFIVQ